MAPRTSGTAPRRSCSRSCQRTTPNTARTWIAFWRQFAGGTERSRTEMTTSPPAIAPATRSAAAERMRRHRERRQFGLRCVTLQVRDAEIEELIRRGLLRAIMRNDVHEIREALYAHLDSTLRAIP